MVSGWGTRTIMKSRMIVQGQLVEHAVCFSDLYDVYLLEIVRDTRQNLWTMIFRSVTSTEYEVIGSIRLNKYPKYDA